ncbi:hypothetical protein J3R83DRAFT_5069 [Lanmaoa asiatica]|nr:hypothetical protein J3R83DRAFT_5069 [Lanmaoa asiatica]
MGHSFPRSAVLVLGQSSVYSLLPSTLFAQVESLLQNGRLAETVALLEQAEADLTQGDPVGGVRYSDLYALTKNPPKETLRYLHQCLAFAFMRQTRFREATAHFVKGAIDPRVPVSYFNELRPALFSEPPNHGKDGSTTSRGAEGDSVEVEVWDGVKEYMPDETSVDDIIATNLVRNYSPYLRPGAIPGSSVEDEPADAEPSTSDSHTKSGTRTHPATIVMREGLRGEASEMVKSVLAAVLGSAEMWSRDVIEVRVLLVLLHVQLEQGESGNVYLVLTEGTHVDSLVVDPLGQIFAILTPTRPDPSTSMTGIGPSLSEHERSSLVKKWAAWLAGKDVERGLKLLMSSQPTRHRRPTGAAGRGGDKAVDRENDTQKADELAILSELRNTNAIAAKRYLEWLETTEEGELFEELVWNCVEEVLEYVGDEGVGKLWRAKAASYASSPSFSATVSSPPPPPPKSDSSPSPNHLTSQSPLRSPFLYYFASTTPDSPSKRARIKTLLLFQSLGEGKKLVNDIQDRILVRGGDKILGLEMAILHSKTPSARIALKTLYTLRDTSTAESYAASAGLTGVISTKLGVSAAEGCGLSDWSGWFARGNGAVGVEGEEKGVQNGDYVERAIGVLHLTGTHNKQRRFLSSQAKRLDALDIFPLVPATWPLRTLSTYLTRSLRRTQHIAHEGQIVKAICAGQNLAVLESTFEVLREEGAIVEEAVSDDEEGRKGEDGVGRSFDEKAVLHGRDEGRAEVVNGVHGVET